MTLNPYSDIDFVRQIQKPVEADLIAGMALLFAGQMLGRMDLQQKATRLLTNCVARAVHDQIADGTFAFPDRLSVGTPARSEECVRRGCYMFELWSAERLSCERACRLLREDA